MILGFRSRSRQTRIVRQGPHRWDRIRFKRFTEKRDRKIKPARSMMNKACVYVVRPRTRKSVAALMAAFAAAAEAIAAQIDQEQKNGAGNE